MKVTVETRPELRVAAVRHLGSYQSISKAFERLSMLGGPAGLFALPGATLLAIYLDDPEKVATGRLRSDACLIVPAGAPLPPGLIEQRVRGGTYACTTHLGPYSTLGDTWAGLKGQWLPRSGYRAGSGPSYELYRNDPKTTPPAELRTDVYLPLG